MASPSAVGLARKAPTEVKREGKMRQQQPTWATPPLDLRHHKWPLELDGANRRLLAPTAGVSTAAATLRFHRKPFCRLNSNLTARDKNNQTLGLDQSA